MRAYEYTALDARGRERHGVIEADTPRQARQQLREQALTPLTVAEVQQRESRRQRGSWWLGRRISPADLALITRQFATLVRAGIPVEEALQSVSRQTDRPRLRSLLLAVRARVKEGYPLARGMGDFPHVFSDLYRATVAAGEQSGHLDGVLERLADYTETRHAMGQKFQLALIYPLLIALVSLTVVIGLVGYVVPKVVSVFEHVGQELPLLTRGLIGLSHLLTTWWPWLLGVVAITLAVAVTLWKQAPVRWALDALLLRLPLLSRLVRGINAARFARTFSILVGSGVAVLEALTISAEVINNRVMRAAVEDAARRVREGSSINAALERSHLFPPMLVHLIASGEGSGKLDEMLERAAVNQEREVETRLATLMGLFEPAMILLMGATVLVIVLAILLPIFDLNQLVK